MVDVGASLADLQGLAAADDGSDASLESSQSALVDTLIGLAEVVAALAVAQHAVVNTDFIQHTGRDFTSESALGLPMHILSTHMDVGTLDSLCYRGESRSRGANHHGSLGILHQGSQLFDELHALSDGVVHLPVACNDRSSSHL